MEKVFIISIILSLWACKEKDLSTENPPTPEGNVELAVSYLYGEERLYPDSILTNHAGNAFFIEELKLLVTGFYIVNVEDTLLFADDFHTFSFEDRVRVVADIPAGGYSGPYGFRLGMDTTQIKDAGSEKIKDSDMIRNQGMGYNSLYIRGRLINPDDPNDSTGGVTFEYEIGGPELYRDFRSMSYNYSVINSKKARFVITVDPEPIFRNIDVQKLLSVSSDKSNVIDYRNATFMMDTISLGLF